MINLKERFREIIDAQNTVPKPTETLESLKTQLTAVKQTVGELESKIERLEEMP